MRLTKILLLTIAIFFASFSKAQMPDSKLSAVYTPEHLNNLKHNNPDAIEYFNFYVNNSFKITDLPQGKDLEKEELHKINPITKEITNEQIQMVDLVDFNPYLFSCKTDQNNRKYYSIGNTGKLLIMFSNKEIQEKFRNSKKIKK
jgi:hypothetical protein